MSTGLIIAIVVIVLILLALAVMLPRMRANNARRQAERELHSRRERAVGEHRSEAAEREATAADRDGDGHTADDRARDATTGEDRTDYDRGREDERRLDRERITDDVRESERR